MNKPKILYIDIETSLMEAYIWSLGDQTVSLPQLKRDWHLMSVGARWAHDPPGKVMYADQSCVRDVRNDKALCKWVWKLLDEADIVVGQNSKRFDVKKLYSRFLHNGLTRPSPFLQYDTLVESRKTFAHTSNKLAYLSDSFCEKYVKLKHGKYPGLSLWIECQYNNNQDAWTEMMKYNKQDVLAAEEYHQLIAPWSAGVNYNLFHDSEEYVCNCGSKHFTKRGFSYTLAGKFQRWVCRECKAWSCSKVNLFSKDKRESLRKRL